MKTKFITTNAKIADGSTVTVNSKINVPETFEELLSLADDEFETSDFARTERHLINLFVGWCTAHTYQSQVRSKLKTASPSLTYDQLSALVDEVPFRIPRPASAPRGDRIVLKKSQLTAEQIAKLREMGML